MFLPKKFQNQKLQTKKNHSIMAVTSNPEWGGGGGGGGGGVNLKSVVPPPPPP